MTSTPKASGMVERVARAICQGRGYDPEMIVYRGVPYLVMGEMAYAPQGEPHPAWHLFVRDARTAIAAMREPTDDVRAALNAAAANGAVNWEDYHAAMIDAALSETASEPACDHREAIMGQMGDGTPVEFCPTCGKNIWIGRLPRDDDLPA